MLFVKLEMGEEEECDRLLSNSKAALLRYHSPSCHHCINMESEWNNLEDDPFLRDHEVIVIDANVSIAEKVKHKSGKEVSKGKGVPTIYFIQGDNMIEYTGLRKTKDIVDFALDSLRRPNHMFIGGKRKKRRTKKKKTRRRLKRSRSRKR